MCGALCKEALLAEDHSAIEPFAAVRVMESAEELIAAARQNIRQLLAPVAVAMQTNDFTGFIFLGAVIKYARALLCQTDVERPYVPCSGEDPQQLVHLILQKLPIGIRRNIGDEINIIQTLCQSG